MPRNALRKERERRGWSRDHMARQIGVSPYTYAQWERGKQTPYPVHLQKLCELFDKSPWELELLVPEKEATLSNQQDLNLPVSSLVESPVQPEETNNKGSTWSIEHKRKWVLIFTSSLLLIGLVVLLCVRTIFPVSKVTHANSSPAHAVSSPVSSSVSIGGPLKDPPGTPIINDSLAQNSVQAQWGAHINCSFTNGAYHLHSIGVNYCLANALTFTDFHYQIQMTLLQGSQAGVVFRADGDSHYYYFYIDIRGAYGVMLVNSTITKLLQSGPIQRLKQTNQFDVVAQGQNFKLYINRQLVTQVQNSSYSSGYIGVCVDTDISDPAQANITTAAYQNAKVWYLGGVVSYN